MNNRPFNLGIDPLDAQARLQSLMQPAQFARGGSVPGYAEGGLMERLRNLLKGDDYQSQGGKTVRDGEVNWGDSDSAADFFRADKARMALDKGRRSVANIERASAAPRAVVAPLPPRRPMPEAAPAPAPDRNDFYRATPSLNRDDSRVIPGAQPIMRSDRFEPFPGAKPAPYGALSRMRKILENDQQTDAAALLNALKAMQSQGETVTGYAQGGVVRGYAEGGPIYDELGNVIAGDNTDYRSVPGYGAVEAASVGAGRAGQAVGEPIRQAAQGIGDIPGAIGSYIAETSQKPDPSQRMAEDIRKFGSAFADQAMSSPTEFAKTVGGFIPGIGEAISAYDAKHLYGDLQKAEAEGDTGKADMLRRLYGLASAGAIPGVGMAARVAGKAKAAIRIGERELPILRSTDDLFEVMDANAHVGRAKPDAMLPIDSVEGGVDLADPKQRARVDALKEKMMGDDGHISRIIVDQDGNVIEGQHRLEALRELGAKEVPVSQFEDLAANVNMGQLGESLDKAQRMGGDQRSSLISNAFDALKEEGSVAKIRENYDAPKGYERGWNAVLDDLEKQMDKSAFDYIPHDNPKRAKNFANWFGKSKMVDDNNKPLVLYHGSKDDIGYFNLHHPNRKDAGWLGTGVYLTDDPDLASIYAKHQKSGPQGPNVMPLYAKLENPFYAPLEFKDKIRNIENSQGKEAARDAADAMTRDLQDKGYDGVVFNYENNKGREVVVFDPTGVKSSTGNNGMFNPKSDVLNKAQGGSVRGYATGGPADDQIEALYNKYTGRSADPEGRAYWQSQLAGMAPEEQDAAFLKGANAAYAANAAAPGPVTDAQIQNLYQQYAGREADQGGLEYWKQKAAAPGATYAGLSNQFRQDVASAGGQDQLQTVKAPAWLEKFDYENFDNPLDAGLDYLKRTLGDKAAAALYGNFNTESYANPQQLQTAGGPNGRPLFDRFTNMPLGMGLAQWSPERQNNLYKFADKYGVDPNSTEGQLRFAVNELTTNPSYSKWLNRLQQPNVDVAGATQIIGKRYEAPARLQQTIAERKAAADLFSRYMNKGTLTPEEQARIASIKGGVKDPMFAAKLKEKQDLIAKNAAAEKAKLAGTTDILGDTGFNQVVDTSVNDRIMQQSNDYLNQSLQNNLNSSFVDANNFNTGLGPYNMNMSFSSGGAQGNSQFPGTSDFSVGVMPNLPDWFNPSPFAKGGSVGYAEGGSFQPMFEGDSEMLQMRAKQLAKQAYSNPRSLSSEDMKEWNLLAGRYNLPFSSQTPMSYEDEMEQRNTALERNMSAKERRRTYAQGGSVDAYDPAEIDAIAAQIRGAA